MIRLDIFSDPVCPWCYIGKTNLDRALATHAGHPFAIEWHPFQLNPDMPGDGLPLADYLVAKFGSRDRAVQAFAQVEAAGAKAGLQIDVASVARTANTLNAHRLIHWAGLEGKQTAIVAALFKAYWRDGRDIGDLKTLATLADESGMDAQVISRLLASDADTQAILDRDRHARERGITAVPTFIIADQYVVSGAQPPELWANVIDDLTAKAGQVQ